MTKHALYFSSSTVKSTVLMCFASLTFGGPATNEYSNLAFDNIWLTPSVCLTLKLHPEAASYPDKQGNYPIHKAVMRRPFRLKYTKLLREILQAYPEAAGKRNKDGDAPIHIAIRERMAWKDGLSVIVESNCDALGLLDRETGLYPVLLCASLGGNVAVNTAFCLLTAKPDIVVNACEK